MGGVFRRRVAVRALALAGPIDSLVLGAVPAGSVSLPELRRLPQITSTIFTILVVELTDVAGCFARLVIIFRSVVLYYMV